tara:strand:+ start:26556 stop:28241 length:1686 start_codon:yes stop_codon:yes gene_type:complete
MYNLFLAIILFSYSISETYSWEDGGTILGSYGNLSDVENVGETDGILPFDGDYMLTVSESPIDGTPQAFIAWVTDISEGDQITACFYGYDTTANSAPSMRVWGSWTQNNDINAYAGSADGNEDYTAGTGWDQVCHTFSTSQENWESGEALVVQARLYSSSSGPDPTKYFVDLVSVETNSATATIHFPGAIEGLIANAGSDQTVDAGSLVTLDGSASLNTDGDIAAYLWEQTSGVAVNLDDEEATTTTFTAPNESTNLVFDLTVYDADGNESTDSITISVIASVGNLTISEIQGEQDSSPYQDQYVTTSGYVMAKNDNGFFIQDAAAAWSGIWVVDFGNANTSVGDEIEVSGQVKEYYDLTELDISDGSSTILSSNNILFEPIVITSASEQYESVLVTVSGICDGLPNEYGEWTLSGTTIDDYLYGSDWGDFNPIIGNEYTITGPLNYAYSLFRVNPRGDEDIQQGILNNSDLINDFSVLSAYPNPFNPAITIQFSIDMTQNIEVSIYDLMGQKVDVIYNDLVQTNTLKSLVWDASDFSSGDYFVSLKTESFTKSHKITLIK